MSSESQNQGSHEFQSDSRDCIDVVFDGPWDNTVRPLTGERRKRAAAEWAKIQYWTAVERGEIDPEKTPPPQEYQAPPRS